MRSSSAVMSISRIESPCISRSYALETSLLMIASARLVDLTPSLVYISSFISWEQIINDLGWFLDGRSDFFPAAVVLSQCTVKPSELFILFLAPSTLDTIFFMNGKPDHCSFIQFLTRLHIEFSATSLWYRRGLRRGGSKSADAPRPQIRRLRSVMQLFFIRTVNNFVDE